MVYRVAPYTSYALRNLWFVGRPRVGTIFILFFVSADVQPYPMSRRRAVLQIVGKRVVDGNEQGSL